MFSCKKHQWALAIVSALALVFCLCVVPVTLADNQAEDEDYEQWQLLPLKAFIAKWRHSGGSEFFHSQLNVPWRCGALKCV